MIHKVCIALIFKIPTYGAIDTWFDKNLKCKIVYETV